MSSCIYLTFNNIIYISDDDNAYVAFTAIATNARDYTAGNVVIFDKSITNIGNHYNSDTSNFICPFDGIYSFSVSIYAGNGRDDMNIHLMRNDELIIGGYAYDNGYDNEVISNSMISVVFECNITQVVWVRCGDYSNHMISYQSHDMASHFTGFLLHRYS